jgi:predicted nucleic acid-binding protein
VIAYVESSWVMRVTLGQEGAADARTLLDAAREGEIELAIPMFSLCEPYTTVVNLARSRRRSFRPIEDQLRDIERTPENQELVEELRARLGDLVALDKREMDSLEGIVRDLLDVATVLPLSAETHARAAQHQIDHGLEPADSIIYATILDDLQTRDVEIAKFFVTTNWKDFDTPGIRDQLSAQGCELLSDFADARARLEGN